MVFSLPLNQMPNVDKELLMSEVHKMSTWSVIIQYIINSKFRQSVKLVDWYNKDCVLAGDKVPSFDGTQKAKCIQALHYVRDYLVYKSDESVHGMLEHWQTPKETLTLRSADCEDGAILLLEILRQSGLPSSQVFLVAGDVQGGGHAYVVWRSDEDLLEYVLDWCYWSNDSLVTPLALNPRYYYGGGEWFRFNWSGSFVKR